MTTTTTTREKRIDFVRTFAKEVKRREEKHPQKVTETEIVTGK